LADRYTGRHIRGARHGAWITKKRSRVRPTAQLLPAAAAVTVAGLLVGGAGTAINVNAAASSGPIADNPTGPSGTQAQADALRSTTADRVSRATPRHTAQAVTPSRVIETGTCDASYYEDPQPTADGEMFDPAALTAAHPSLPFNSEVRVTNLANGKSVVVRINDRGPSIENRCLDLSRAAFATIANLSTGVVDVRYDVLVQDAT
jgi:rare lipoprotein A